MLVIAKYKYLIFVYPFVWKQNKRTIMEKTTIVNKRFESSKGYVDSLSDQYSKLNMVRIDLGYGKDENEKVDITLEEANQDLNRMLNNRRSKPSIFKDQVGYIIKKEYTKDKGVHLHALFIFNGQNVKKASYKAKQIGEYWNELTQEHNGNNHSCHYKEYKEHGIDMLDYRDTDKREILDKNVLTYLCKDDKKQDIKAIQGDKRVKAFIRGTIPKSKSNMGRPREQ